MRLFFGVWPPAELGFALAELAVRIRPLSGGRAIPAPNIHLTLAFLGEVPAARAEAARAAARRVRVDAGAFRLGAVRYWKRSGVVWAGPMEVPAGLAALAGKLHEELQAEGFTLEARPFVPHVTLLRKARASGPLPVPPQTSWPVTEFLLVRSDQTQEGSAYTPVARFAL